MTGVFAAGDKDILRAAKRPETVFWERFRRGRSQLNLILILSVLLAASLALLILGPEGTGLSWATRDIMAFEVSVMGIMWLGYTLWTVFKFMPSRNDRVVLDMRRFVCEEVDPLEERLKALSDDELRAFRPALSERLKAGEPPEAIRAEAYALVREASRRARAHRHFECQLIGARVIERCNIAEMRTGEGKTIVCYAACYMKVLAGLKVHMVTVNDYLVRRDAEFCRPIFDLLGVSVGCITSDMQAYGPEVEGRRVAYACDITYGTNSEFGFDYLRDNMKQSVRDQVQGRQDFVVVDEVDSILIDEARTPLIISGPSHDDAKNYSAADNIARSLIRKQQQSIQEVMGRIDRIEEEMLPADAAGRTKFKGAIKKFRSDPLWLTFEEGELIGFKQYFTVEADRKQAHMTEHGAKAAQAELGQGTFYESRNMNWPHYIDKSLQAHLVYQRDKDYVVQEDTIIIVDEFTGRLMHGRQWSDGLHQAVEAKERVTIKQETQTLATITLQNLFKLYRQLAGMTGTAMTESEEFMKIYRLEVIAIPTNKPIRRVDYNDKIYKSKDNKLAAIVEEVHAYSQKGYPADPWSLYDMLKSARGRLTLLREHKELDQVGMTPAETEQALAIIKTALDAFRDGAGEAAPLEEAYLKLVGQNVGGRPVLVGTTSVESSERLSQELRRSHGVEHEVLNAKNHAREAEIIKKAGQQHEFQRGSRKETHGNVTIATNMAGRGTDIVLGPGVALIGGLHVIGTERHESRRIDNQLRGRCGRQGDPGSSRFFLSLEDDLLRLFMGEWMLKMLARYGMVEGVPIESNQLTRNIQAAQKKVEERNFGMRKHLLDYDEVMDYQRKRFYELRQRVVEGRRMSEVVWELIDESVADAVRRFYDPLLASQAVAEWVSQHVGVMLDPTKIDPVDFRVLQDQVREQGIAEMRSHVQRTFGEYVDLSEDTEEWDVRGLIAWAGTYGLNWTQRQVKETAPEALLDELLAAAQQRVEQADLSGIEVFCDAQFGRQRLSAWAREKFGLTISVEELQKAGNDEAEPLIVSHMRAAYRQRELEYPAAAVIEFAIQAAGQNVNELYSRVARWVNRKYRLDWNYERLNGKTPQQIFAELRALAEEFSTSGRIDAEIDAALREHPGPAVLDWARERFSGLPDVDWIDPEGDLPAQLRACYRELLRYELSQLERIIMLSTLDAVWKDHMYAMDLLRSGIWMRGQAERDPKIEYKREGTRLFNTMMSNIRERVTDLIFKVEVAGGTDGSAAAVDPARRGPEGPASPYARAVEGKADATNAAFSGAASAESQAQQTDVKPQTIRRDVPAVGRNDPCPCGSGKKYKQCHGKSA